MKFSIQSALIILIFVSCKPGLRQEKLLSDSLVSKTSKDTNAPGDTDSLNAVSNTAASSNVATETNFRLGFSDDGRYAGVFWVWENDTPSGYVANLVVNDVDQNKSLTSKETINISSASIPEALQKAQVMYKNEISKYNISVGSTGTSYAVDEESNAQIPFNNKIYRLTLITRSAADANKYFELQVLTDAEPIMLHQDIEVPKSRGLVNAYKVVACYVFEEKIAVVILFMHPEKKSTRGNSEYIFVTGVLV